MDELKRQNEFSTQIFDALRSDHQVPVILKLLKGQEDLTVIAYIASSPPTTQSSISPSLVMVEGVSQQPNGSAARKDLTAIEEGLVPDPTERIHC